MIETVRAIFKCGLSRQDQAPAIIDVNTPGCAAYDERKTGPPKGEAWQAGACLHSAAVGGTAWPRNAICRASCIENARETP